MSPRVWALVLICVSIAAVALTGSTYVRALQSQLAVADMDISLLDVRQSEPREFAIDVLVINTGEISTAVISAEIFLYWGDRVVAYEKWYPEDLIVRPRAEQGGTVSLTSPLSEENLPPVGPTRIDEWSVRVKLELTHPMRHGSFELNREARPTP